MGHYNHTIVHHHNVLTVNHNYWMPRGHSCCGGPSIWGGYGGGCCGGGTKGGFWGGFGLGFGQCLGGWLGGMMGGLMYGMMGGGLFGGMMGMPFMGGGGFPGFNIYPENYDYGMMNMGYTQMYSPYTAALTTKPATSNLKPLRTEGTKPKGTETEDPGAVTTAADPLAEIVKKSTFTDEDIDTILQNIDLLADKKDDIKAKIEKQLKDLKTGNDNEYKMSTKYDEIKALELLCKLEPKTVVNVEHNPSAEVTDNWIKGRIFDVKKDASGNITYKIECNCKECAIIGATYVCKQHADGKFEILSGSVDIDSTTHNLKINKVNYEWDDTEKCWKNNSGQATIKKADQPAEVQTLMDKQAAAKK